MTKYLIRKLPVLMISIAFYSIMQVSAYAAESYEFKDLHHHGRTTVCMAQCPQDLSKKQLDRFFASHLGESTKRLNLSWKTNLDDNHLKMLADSSLSSTIIELNLMGTSITYDGISHLWESKFLGSVRSDDPIYDSYYNQPVSVVKIEIGHTPARKQYKKLLAERGKKMFPLPLRDKFVITFLDSTGHSSTSDEDQETIGFKEIILLNHGKEIK